MSPGENSRSLTKAHARFLLGSMLVVSFCGILYELLIGTCSSYLLGDSVTQFSLSIGFFMFFMGVGAYLSKFVKTRMLITYVKVELLLAIVGGFSTLALLASYSYSNQFYLVGVLIIAVLGCGIGVEVPLVTRMLVRDYGTTHAIAATLGFDYLGALIASVAFPLILLPWLGLVPTSLAVGLVNAIIAGATLMIFRSHKDIRDEFSRLIGATGVVGVSLCGGLYSQAALTSYLEREAYQDQIVYSGQSPYQRIVLTNYRDDTRLFLNGNLQLSSTDEYRYHEPLVHVPMSLHRAPRRVLVLGGGDGVVAKEVLKHERVEEVVLVDLDPKVLRLATSHRLLWRINRGALEDPRVKVVISDAYRYVSERLEGGRADFDVVIADLPDPNDESLGKLYSRQFYRMMNRLLRPGGILITQATSPYFAREAFWSIVTSVEREFGYVWPVKTQVPSFGGTWGFAMASDTRYVPGAVVLKKNLGLRYLEPDGVSELFNFPPDISRVNVESSSILDQRVVRYYRASAERWE